MSKKKGIWFYGLSGSGKSYATKLLYKKIKKPILIDGDEVRKNISFDLKYSKNDRNIQLKRMLGLGKIAINSNIFPLLSTVWMNKKILNSANKIGIKVIKVEANIKELIKTHKTYGNKKDVVGINIQYEKNLNSTIIKNNKDNKFWNTLKKLI
tara:strand:+ start:362 stop:820 length:459 start_codon:yes stop_codon:yes gene_type:complete